MKKKNNQAQIRVCRQSAVLPSKLSVQPVPPPHVSINKQPSLNIVTSTPMLNLTPPLVNLTPPYHELTQWIRGLLADQQLTMDHIRQLRKPFRVVSTSSRGSTKVPVIHRVECVIYPKPYKIISENINIDDLTKEANKENDNQSKDNIDNNVDKFVSAIPARHLSREISCEKDDYKDVGSDGFLVEDDDIITLVLNGQENTNNEG